MAEALETTMVQLTIEKLRISNEKTAAVAAAKDQKELEKLRKAVTNANDQDQKSSDKAIAELKKFQQNQQIDRDLAKQTAAARKKFNSTTAGQAAALKKSLEAQGKVAKDDKEFSKLTYQAQKQELELRIDSKDISPAAKKELAEERRALMKKDGSRLDKIAAGITGMWTLGKASAKTALKGGLALLGTLAFGAALIAFGKFMQSPKFKEWVDVLIPKIMTGLEAVGGALLWMGEAFHNMGTLFSGEDWDKRLEKLKKGELADAFDGLGGAITTLVASLAGIVFLLRPAKFLGGLLKIAKAGVGLGAGSAAAKAAKAAAATEKARKLAKAAAVAKAAQAAARKAAVVKKASEAAARQAAALKKAAEKAAKAAAAARRVAQAAALKKAAEKARKAAEKARKASEAAARQAAAVKKAAEKARKAARRTRAAAAVKKAVVAPAAKLAKIGGQIAGVAKTGTTAVATAAKTGGSLVGKIAGKFSHLKKYPRLMLAAKRLPFVGPLLSGGMAISILMGDKSHDEKVKAIGGLLGGGLGSAAFATIGAALGGLFTGPGAVVAAPLGGIIGGLVGWMGGEWAGAKLAGFLMGDYVEVPKTPKMPNVADAADAASAMSMVKDKSPQMPMPARESIRGKSKTFVRVGGGKQMMNVQEIEEGFESGKVRKTEANLKALARLQKRNDFLTRQKEKVSLLEEAEKMGIYDKKGLWRDSDINRDALEQGIKSGVIQKEMLEAMIKDDDVNKKDLEFMKQLVERATKRGSLFTHDQGLHNRLDRIFPPKNADAIAANAPPRSAAWLAAESAAKAERTADTGGGGGPTITQINAQSPRNTNVYASGRVDNLVNNKFANLNAA